jgi:O-antigen chain-terminating methyltransferase
MNKMNMPNITTDVIIKKIKEEVSLIKQASVISVQDKTGNDGIMSMMTSEEDVLLQELLTKTLDCLPQNATLGVKKAYNTSDFLDYHDEIFVRNTYRCILGREPDFPGLQYYLEKLRSGEFNKVEILGRIRYSPEGRSKKIKINNILPLFAINRIYAIPVMGYIARLITGIINLPAIINNINKYEVYTQSLFSQSHTFNNQMHQVVKALSRSKADTKSLIDIEESVKHIRDAKAGREQVEELLSTVMKLTETKANNDAVNQLQQQLYEINNIKADMDEISNLSNKFTQMLEAKADNKMVAEVAESIKHIGATKADQEKVAELLRKVMELAETKANNDAVNQLQLQFAQFEKTKAFIDAIQMQFNEIQLQILDHKRNILDQQRRLAILLNESKQYFTKTVSDKKPSAMISEEDHLLDALYVKFADLFRGTREDIKKRQAIYLPLIQAAKAGTKSSPVIDVGCGRGEWIELLKENQLIACGVDHNAVIIKECLERELDVVEADIIHHLQKLKPNSAGAITCFHVIEHLPLNIMIQLFDETFRLLKPGGVAIYETPNPENLIVGACNFYLDPTHRNPLPPALTGFLLESRGLSRIEIKRLHPFPDNNRITGKEQELLNRCNELFYGFQDYAVICYKN